MRRFIGYLRGLTPTGRMIFALVIVIAALVILLFYGLFHAIFFGMGLLAFIPYFLISFACSLLGVVFFVRADLKLPQGGWNPWWRFLPTNRSANEPVPWVTGFLCVIMGLVLLPQGVMPLAFPATSFEFRFVIYEAFDGAILVVLAIGFLVAWLRRQKRLRATQATSAQVSSSASADAPPPRVSRRTLLASAGIIGLELFGAGWLISHLPVWVPRQTFHVTSDIAASEIAWAPDGRRLSGLASRNMIAIWNPTTGATLQTLSGDYFNDMAWSPDGSQIAIWGVIAQSQAVQVWDGASGRVILTRNLPSTLQASYDAPLLWHEDQLLLVVTSSEATSDGYVFYVWEVLTNTARKLFTMQSIPSNLIFSPNRSYLAGYDLLGGQLALWAVATGKLVITHTFPQKSELDGIQSLAWAPDGQRIAVGLAYNRAIVLDALTGAHRQTLQGPLDSFNQFPDLTLIRSLAWSPDGAYLAAASSDTTVRIWRVPMDGQPQTSFVWAGHFGGVESVVWSPTGKLLASESSGTVQVWSPTGDLWQAQ